MYYIILNISLMYLIFDMYLIISGGLMHLMFLMKYIIYIKHSLYKAYILCILYYI